MDKRTDSNNEETMLLLKSKFLNCQMLCLVQIVIQRPLIKFSKLHEC